MCNRYVYLHMYVCTHTTIMNQNISMHESKFLLVGLQIGNNKLLRNCHWTCITLLILLIIRKALTSHQVGATTKKSRS